MVRSTGQQVAVDGLSFLEAGGGRWDESSSRGCR